MSQRTQDTAVPKGYELIGIKFGTPHLFQELVRTVIEEAVRQYGPGEEAARALGIRQECIDRFVKAGRA
jgi:hypothetical protein